MSQGLTRDTLHSLPVVRFDLLPGRACDLLMNKDGFELVLILLQPNQAPAQLPLNDMLQICSHVLNADGSSR